MEGDRAAGAHLGMPHLPVLAAPLRRVIPVDEDEVDLRARPGAPHVLGAGDVPLDARAARPTRPAVPAYRPLGGERSALPAAGQRPADRVDERIDEMQRALRAERLAEHDRRRAL